MSPMARSFPKIGHLLPVILTNSVIRGFLEKFVGTEINKTFPAKGSQKPAIGHYYELTDFQSTL
jgi:hypothetical protein